MTGMDIYVSGALSATPVSFAKVLYTLYSIEATARVTNFPVVGKLEKF